MLKDSHVQSYKGGGVELLFHVELVPSAGAPLSSPPSSNQLLEVPIDEKMIPPDLRADVLMDGDKILNWSAPGAQDDHSIPLTGDTPLTEGV